MRKAELSVYEGFMLREQNDCCGLSNELLLVQNLGQMDTWDTVVCTQQSKGRKGQQTP